jgi:UDP-glucose 4-epimerase
VAIFTERMLRDQQAYINGDGQQTRDYVFVEDVVQANMKSLAYDQNGIFNVGTEVETDVVELFKVLQKLTGTSIELEHAEGKPGEQQRSVVGTQKIQERLDWQQQYDLEEGLQKTVEWFKQKMEAQAS